jgi:hypothetical protein
VYYSIYACAKGFSQATNAGVVALKQSTTVVQPANVADGHLSSALALRHKHDCVILVRLTRLRGSSPATRLAPTSSGVLRGRTWMGRHSCTRSRCCCWAHPQPCKTMQHSMTSELTAQVYSLTHSDAACVGWTRETTTTKMLQCTHLSSVSIVHSW